MANIKESMQYKGRSQQSGFTLLELLVVVGIGSLLLMVAAPGMQNLTSSISVDSQLKRVSRDLMFARNQAVNLGATVRVCTLDSSNVCNGADNTGYTIFVDADSDSTLDAGETTLATYDGFDASSTVSLSRSSVMFSPEGLSAGNQATLTYTAANSNFTGTVSTSQLGSVSSSNNSVY